MKTETIHPATHSYKGFPAIPVREKKCACGRRTTGRARNATTKKETPLCSVCAPKKGF